MFLENAKKYFDECNVALADKFIPYYCSSVACHLANLENQEREFYIRQGKRQDLRLHIFFVAPPGYSKTLMLRRFLGDAKEKKELNTDVEIFRDNRKRDSYSILSKAPIETAFEDSMNEASFVGSIKEEGNKVSVVRGAAYEHRRSILGIDEFSILSDTMNLSYGKTLDNALLTALDSGYLKKRLKLGKISYITHMTLWSGGQPMRFDLTSGLGRRLFFIFFIPKKEEEEKIKIQSRKNETSYPSNKTLEKLSDDVEMIKTNLSKIEDLTFDSEIYDFFDEYNFPHYEEELMRRFALGYHLSTNEDIESEVKIKLTDDLKKEFIKSIRWRKEIKRGPQVSQVMKILDDRGTMKLKDLKDKLLSFGLNYKQATNAIRELKSSGIITVNKRQISNNRTRTYVSLSEIA